MTDDDVSDYASPSQWIAEANEDLIVGAFETSEEAARHYSANQSLLIRPVPGAVANGRFVWAVSTRADHIDSIHGGDAHAATRRCEEIGGKLILFAASVDE